MDMAVVATIFLAAAGVVALLILFMTFEPAYLKRLAIFACFLFAVPLLIALLGNSMGWFDVYTLEIISLRQGAFSVITTASYGVMAGVILNSIKIWLINALRRMRNQGSTD
ncbi:MAG: hypothetical protein ACE5E3_01350 [Mariprofundus sp.]